MNGCTLQPFAISVLWENRLGLVESNQPFSIGTFGIERVVLQ